MKNISLRKSLQKKYGKKAEEIYAAMENEWNPATSKKAIAKSKKDHPSWYWIKKKDTKKQIIKKIVKKSIIKKKKSV